jgi:hypothetical protein
LLGVVHATALMQRLDHTRHGVFSWKKPSDFAAQGWMRL